jgi:hypothetical protein
MNGTFFRVVRDREDDEPHKESNTTQDYRIPGKGPQTRSYTGLEAALEGGILPIHLSPATFWQ